MLELLRDVLPLVFTAGGGGVLALFLKHLYDRKRLALDEDRQDHDLETAIRQYLREELDSVRGRIAAVEAELEQERKLRRAAEENLTRYRLQVQRLLYALNDMRQRAGLEPINAVEEL